MKKIILGIALLLLSSLIACNKTNSNTEIDQIIYEEINKTITFSKPDSIPGTCKALIFMIESDREAMYDAMIKINNNMLACDGFNNILVNPTTRDVLSLDDKIEISQSDNWVGIQDLDLEDFAGQGEKYIAYRAGLLPEGVTNYRYGWIKIKLSEHKDTLEIISRATNHTNNKLIYSGQYE